MTSAAILFLPVVSLIIGLFRVTSTWWYPTGMVIATGVAGFNFYEVVLCGAVKKTTIMSNFLSFTTPNGYEAVELGVYLDFYSANMVWIVFLISLGVHLYSVMYMKEDPRLNLFLCYLTLFTFFMVVLLVAPNYVQLFLGWEGVGLTSYLLVNFWTTRVAANKAALKALIVNRVGDVFLLYFLFLYVIHYQTFNFIDVGLQSLPPAGLATAVVIAAAAKSAQLGLHTWLPDAMEGPTPVSALIHAATMVTAGVFLLLRSVWFLDEVKPLLLFLGSTTTLFAGSVALFQYDLKRVIAYSTCAQLGYMVVAVAVGASELSLYHLINHAYFKALLFLLAGLVIHALYNEQDTRRMGGLINIMPVTYVLFLVASAALVGFPFLSGYYSKEGILEILYAKQLWYAYGACVVGAYFTAYYSFRTLYLVFGGKPKGNKPAYLVAHEADPLSLGVVSILGLFALGHGFVTRDLFIGLGNTHSWGTPYLEAEFAVPLLIKLLPLLLSFVAVSVCIWSEKQTISSWLPIWGTNFFAKRWWWDFLDATAARAAMVKVYTLYVDLERGLLEWLGPTGIRWLLTHTYESVRNRGWFPLFFGLLGTSLLIVSVGYFILELNFIDVYIQDSPPK